MIIKQAELETVCGITSKLPENEWPEVAFAGKSNVGKSSLINGLLNRKSLARTSSQPGKTQTINFYKVNGDLYLVDLPGYGYAKVSNEIKAKWGKMIERYLHGSKQLRAVFLLIDIRHDPSANDKTMYDWVVHQGFEPIIIATKLDKIKRSQVQKQIKAIKEGLNLLPGTKVIPFSAETKQGRDEIWEIINSLREDESEEDASGDSLIEIDAGILALHEENPDCIGWLTIDGTRIDYPVMYRPGDKNYYLHRDFNGEYSANGCLFLAEECVPGNSDNLIIYGHHMNSGKMFADLEKYKDEGFYEEHPTILFRTIWGNEQYQIFVAFTTPVYTGNDFDYYSFIKAGTVEDYKKFVASVKEKSLYQTGTTAKYRDKLLTLSTCEYSQKNGRMVLVAKKNNGKLP